MEQYSEIAEKIIAADAILIGASNGLSITEGLHLFADNEAFETLLGDYKEKYGFHRILDGFFYPWNSPVEKWGFFSRLIQHYSGNYVPTQVMCDLKTIVGDKPYFILTSNGEGHFELSGFDPDKVYELEGNWLEMQCSHHCHRKTYPALPVIQQMAAQEKDGIVPESLLPKCPKCGAIMELYSAMPPKESIENAWENFLTRYHNQKLVILELGIGWRNQLIKAPLMELTAKEPQAAYITINLGEIFIADNIKEKSYGLDGYLSTHLKNLAEEIISRKSDTTLHP